MRRTALLVLACLLSVSTLAHASSSTRIPAFARKYRVSCATCHSPIPRLNAVGEAFAANGFEFAGNEIPRDTINTGDPLLRLQNNLPLAIRYDAYVTALSKANNGQVVYDQQMPWVVKLLSGGQVANKISYYIYFLMTERGEVEGLEDAYVQFTDVGGRGLAAASGSRQYDRDNAKAYLARLSQDVGRLRLGGFAYFNDEKHAGATNSVRMFGPDATLAFSEKLELNAQLLRRTDDNPLFGATATESIVDAAFAEMIFSPRGQLSRVHFTALANVIYGDRALIDMRLGQGPVGSYRTFGFGAHHVLRRNVRTMVEGHWDAVAEQGRLVGGASLAW